MTLFVLDTDILTLYQTGHPAVVRHVHACSADKLAVSVISVEEELTGWYTKLRRAKQRQQLARAYQRLADAVRFLSHVNVLAFPESAILRYEKLRATYKHTSKNDLRIAAIVMDAAATLVTRNREILDRFPV